MSHILLTRNTNSYLYLHGNLPPVGLIPRVPDLEADPVEPVVPCAAHPALSLLLRPEDLLRPGALQTSVP